MEIDIIVMSLEGLLLALCVLISSEAPWWRWRREGVIGESLTFADKYRRLSETKTLK